MHVESIAVVGRRVTHAVTRGQHVVDDPCRHVAMQMSLDPQTVHVRAVFRLRAQTYLPVVQSVKGRNQGQIMDMMESVKQQCVGLTRNHVMRMVYTLMFAFSQILAPT